MGKSGKPEFLAFDSRMQASLVLADELETTLRSALADSASVTLVVSGGTSPVEMFHSLSQRDLDWERVTVIPSDERVVTSNHPERNDAMIRRELLIRNASAANLTSLLPEANDASPEEETIKPVIPAVIDAVVLGMGDDGHTASLFPDSPGIENALQSQRQLLRMSVPRLQAKRISLTPAALLTGKRIDLLFFGLDKRAVFEAAMKDGPASTYPIRAVLHQNRVPVRVFWAP